jgi:hypothetical protein
LEWLPERQRMHARRTVPDLSPKNVIRKRSFTLLWSHHFWLWTWKHLWEPWTMGYKNVDILASYGGILMSRYLFSLPLSCVSVFEEWRTTTGPEVRFEVSLGGCDNFKTQLHVIVEIWSMWQCQRSQTIERFRDSLNRAELFRCFLLHPTLEE